MENHLFEWEAYDEIGVAALNFYDCTLKVQIGKFVVGSIFSSIYVDFSQGLLAMCDGEQEVAKFNLLLSVGEEIPSE